MTIADLIQQWTEGSTSSLTEAQSKELLREAGFQVADSEPVPPGIELRIALEQDPLFGPVVSFGFGRLAVDVWEDVTYRVVPLTPKDSKLMVREPKGRRLLEGYRSLEAPDVSLIEQTLLRLSGLAEQFPQLREVDLDPVYAYPDHVVVAGVRVELSGSQ
jgi:acetyl-CoA synthetase (ADP-forming)